MSEDLDRALEALAQAAPDPPADVVATQRARLIAHIDERSRPHGHRDSQPSNRSRTSRSAWISIAAALTIVALLSGVMLAIRLGDGSTGRVRGEQVSPAGVALTASTVEAMLVPGSAEQYQASARRLLAFETSIRQTVDPGCAGGTGPATALGRYFDGPEIVRSQGVTGQVAGIGSQCASADAALAPLDAVTSSLSQSWLAAVQTVEGSDAVASALTRWRSCMTASGHAVATIDDVLSEAQSLAASPTPDTAILETLVKDYASCLGSSGVVAERKAGIASIREHFLTQHAEELRAAESQLPGVVDSLSHRYGVSFPN